MKWDFANRLIEVETNVQTNASYDRAFYNYDVAVVLGSSFSHWLNESSLNTVVQSAHMKDSTNYLATFAIRLKAEKKYLTFMMFEIDT